MDSDFMEEDNAPQVVAPMDLYDRQPCWYADFDCESSTWKIGVSGQEEKMEFTFKDDLGRNKDPEFAIKVLEIYRSLGQQGVIKYVNDQ